MVQMTKRKKPLPADIESPPLFYHRCNCGEFPLEIKIENDHTNGMAIQIRSWPKLVTMGTTVVEKEPPAVSEVVGPVGKLTGLQLRTLAAIDQVEAMIKHEMLLEIKTLAGIRDPDLVAAYVQKQLFCPEPDIVNEQEMIWRQKFALTISTLAMFCYRELLDRGLAEAVTDTD